MIDDDSFNDDLGTPVQPQDDDVILPDDIERDMSPEAIQRDCDEFLEFYKETSGGVEYDPDVDGDLADEIWAIHSEYESNEGGHRSLTESAKKYLADTAADKAFLDGFDEG